MSRPPAYTLPTWNSCWRCWAGIDAGKSVIIIAHHRAVMAHADWIIDLGPGAGYDGGRIMSEGIPADRVAACSTLTGKDLAAYVGT
jgi:excinuclease UvrABC ATPase subunit